MRNSTVYDAPHPAFGHPLPAPRGEGQLEFVALLPARGEKVREARMRGVRIEHHGDCSDDPSLRSG